MSQLQIDFEQRSQLERVTSRIGSFVVDFFESIEVGREFHASELKNFVAAKNLSIAPGSPDRIMRDLRKRNVVNYELVSRSKSLYRKVAVE